MAWSKSHNLADLAYVDVQEYLRSQDTVLVPRAGGAAAARWRS